MSRFACIALLCLPVAIVGCGRTNTENLNGTSSAASSESTAHIHISGFKKSKSGAT
jgi:hypothetical protein